MNKLEDFREKQLPTRESNFWLRFLAWYCPDSLYEGIEGDIIEQFETDLETMGEKIARRKLMIQTLRFFRPEILLKNKMSANIINTIMLNNYIKVATRNIAKRKLYSFINAFGLSIGICFSLLVYLFIQDEKSFDQFHENKDRIFRVESRSFDTWNNNPDEMYSTSAYLQSTMQPALKTELPEVQYATRFNTGFDGIVKYKDKIFTEKLTFADADFFRMFSFQLVEGNVDNVFGKNSDVVLTAEKAKKYFGSEEALGKIIQLTIDGKESDFVVAGIIGAPPFNSSIQFDVLIPQANRPNFERQIANWGSFNTATFVQLVPNASLRSFKDNLDKILQKNMARRMEDWKKNSARPVPADVVMMEYVFTELTGIHFKKDVSWEKVSDPQYSWILGGIALLILSIACINYISLSLTTSASRKTEVGIRKVVGAQRNQLMYQFAFESLLLALGSMVIAFGLVILFLPYFNNFTDKNIVLTVEIIMPLLLTSFGITIAVGLLAGSYPSFFLSRFKPVAVLKGRFTSKLQTGFTKPLVVLQFALSAFLIISSIIMYKQMQYVTTKNLGFDKNQVVVIPTQSGYSKEANIIVQRFRQRSLQEPLIAGVSGTSASFNQGYSMYGYQVEDEQKSAYVFSVDAHYLPLLNITLKDGRNFNPSIPGDSNCILVNEALVKDMKWKDPLNEYLNWREDSTSKGDKVIGVVKDYHFLSLQSEVAPMFLTLNEGFLTSILVKLSSKDITAGLDKIKSIWKEQNPDKPFDYTFMDEDVAKQYQSQQRWMSIMGLATIFAIIISCLGLFGLAGINAINRTKEIGIRKVMGADVKTIFVLLNSQYVWLSLIAYALAIPCSWYLMEKWLSDFKFKIAIGVELFAIAIAAGLAVALLTVSYHAIKAAFLNPAETLKYE